MSYKKFSKKLYSQNDAQAKTLAIEFFQNRYPGSRVVENPNQYGPDLELWEGDLFYGYIECEVKHSWKTKDFPYNTIQIPSRKAKYFVENLHPIVLFMLNSDHSAAFIIDGEDISASPLVEVPNKYVASGEKFFQVPVSKAQKILIDKDR